jgi:hypothetical protein
MFEVMEVLMSLRENERGLLRSKFLWHLTG